MKKIIALLLAFIMLMSFCPAALGEDSLWNREEYYADSISAFSTYDYSDPMHITDEDFFGIWEENAWKSIPFFSYEEYPDMEKVEEAAKKGDYETCKKELKAYYKGRYETFNIPNTVSKSPSEKTLTEYETLFDNFIVPYDLSVSGRLIFGEEPSWVSMELTSDVQAAAKANEKKKIYQIIASNKDGYKAVIDSIESGNGAYVEVLVNGAYRRFEATKDNYVQRKNDDDNFINAEKLLVEESVSSIGKDPLKPFDEYTKTAFIEFDFTGLLPNDQVSKATLYIRGSMEEGDSPAGIRKQADYKSLYVMPYVRDASLDIDTLTFKKYKTYNTMYRSFDGDKFVWQVAVDRENGTIDTTKNDSTLFSIRNYLTNAYNGYLATGDETFAYHIIRVFLSCIQEGGSWEEKIRYHDNDTYNLNMSFNTMGVASTLSDNMKYLIKSEYMTPEIFTTIMKFFWECGQILIDTWGSGEEANNWGGYSCTGLQYLYIFFPEFRSASLPLVEIPRDERYPASVTGGWAEVEQYRRAYKAMDDFYEDGTAVERSTTYSFEGINTLLNVLDVADIVGNVDKSTLFTPEMTERIEKATLYLVNHMTPRFGDWQVGDGGPFLMNYATRVQRVTKLVKGNPYLDYVASTRTEGTKPPYLTVTGDTIGKVTFRNSWEANAVAGHLENAGGSGSHGHNDDLSLTVAAYGNYLLVDPLMGNYNVSEPMERWASSTRGHNTVEINDTIGKGSKYYHENDKDLFGETMIVPLRQYNKKSGNLYPENRELNTIYDFVRGESYAYTDHNRMEYDYKVFRDILFMHNGYFLVTDYIEPEKSDNSNKYKQMWHFKPNAEISIDRETNSVRTNFDGDANVVVATVKEDTIKFPTITEGLFASTKGNFQKADYAFFEQNKEGISTFNTIIYPLGVGDKSKVSTKDLVLDISKEKAHAFSADIYSEENDSFKTISYYSLRDTSLLAQRAFGAYSTDGEVALAEKMQDEFSTALLRNGKNLKNDEDDTYVIYSTQKISDLGVEWKETSLYLASSKLGEDDLKNVTVYSKKTVDSVYLNDKKIGFSQSGRYVYFGTTPIIDESAYIESITPDNPTVDEPVHGGTVSTPTDSSSGGGNLGGGGGGGAVSSGNNKEDNEDKEEIQNENVKKFSAELDNHWAKKEISSLVEKGVITGDDKGKLNLSDNITRAEFITMLVRAMKFEENPYSGQFGDVSQDSWYAPYIEMAFKNGIIEGDGGNIHPDRKITREEMTKMVALAVKEDEKEKVPQKEFSDEENISPWAKEYIAIAARKGLVNGMENGEFRPKDNAKREQAMVIIYRLLNLK